MFIFCGLKQPPVIDLERLTEYGEWYYCRYLPSNKRLLEVLLRKSGKNEELAKSVYQTLEPLLTEERAAEMRVRAMREAGKSARNVKNKLLQKGFTAEYTKRDYNREEAWQQAEPRIRLKAER